MWGGGWGFGWIFPLFMFLMMIGCVAFFLFGHGSGGRHPHHSALEILNGRYARGEIQKQEYEEKKTAILSPGQP
jgi:putative membrane protein